MTDRPPYGSSAVRRRALVTILGALIFICMCLAGVPYKQIKQRGLPYEDMKQREVPYEETRQRDAPWSDLRGLDALGIESAQVWGVRARVPPSRPSGRDQVQSERATCRMSVTADVLQSGDWLVTRCATSSSRAVSSRACSAAFECCTGMAHSREEMLKGISWGSC